MPQASFFKWAIPGLFIRLFNSIDDSNQYSICYHSVGSTYSALQCRICNSKPVWPDWEIFESSFAANFLINVAQKFGNFLGYFKVCNYVIKTTLVTFWASTGKFGSILIPASGHTAHKVPVHFSSWDQHPCCSFPSWSPLTWTCYSSSTDCSSTSTGSTSTGATNSAGSRLTIQS